MNKPDCKLCRMAYREEFAKSMFGKCQDCEKMKRYNASLERKRKFKSGDTINSLDELLAQEWVMSNDRPKHIKAVTNMQLATVLMWIERKYFRKAIRKEDINV